jgi:hypothetical protein
VADELKFESTAPAANRPPPSRDQTFPAIRARGLLTTKDSTLVATLALLLVLGFGLRVNQLGAIGFAEDEMNKLQAVYAYGRGDITSNGEHPMMMKAMMFASVGAARALGHLSDETALRLPNALFGTLTVIPLFLLTAALFDRWTAYVASAFWAFGVTAITFNRIGKEDTLLVFFMLFAFYFYLRAKQTTPYDKRTRWRNYLLSSTSFGLMLASKYFPHYFGLNALYHHNIHVREKQAGEPSGKTPGLFYLLVIIVFLLANPAVLLPQVWGYLNEYMGERLLVHTGYLFAGKLYKNTMSGSPFWGTPIYFYLLFMVIKIPISVLVPFLIGLGVSIRRWRHPAYMFVLFMFLFWIVPYSLIGSKWLRYTLSLMPFVYMLAAVGVVESGRLLLNRFTVLRQAPVVVSSIVAFVFIGLSALTAFANGPHYALYTNAFGNGKAGYYFPHDEFYDDGLREAIKFVCDSAPENALIAHETPGVARYYLSRFNRTDIQSKTLSAPDFDPARESGATFIIAQSGRVYFENQAKLVYVRSNFRKIHEVRIDGLIAAEVFVNR